MPVASTLGSGEQDILHFGAVKFRVNGAGNLRLRFLSLDSAVTQTLVPIVMSSTPGKQPNRLCNFISERGMLEGKTTVINEIFRINKIILFSKPLWTEYSSVVNG
jgi:hypothetical protein